MPPGRTAERRERKSELLLEVMAREEVEFKGGREDCWFAREKKKSEEEEGRGRGRSAGSGPGLDAGGEK